MARVAEEERSLLYCTAPDRVGRVLKVMHRCGVRCTLTAAALG